MKKLIKSQYTKWQAQDRVLLIGGTGSGKTFFVETVLLNYAKKCNKSMLYLTNRDILKAQICNDLNDSSNCVIANYQYLETSLSLSHPIATFDYIICDEAQYFFLDSTFNHKTDISLQWILAQNSCTIFMSATPKCLLRYFDEESIFITNRYNYFPDYSYIKDVYVMASVYEIEHLIKHTPEHERLMFFTKNISLACELAKNHGGSFVCSAHNVNNDYIKSIDELARSQIVTSSSFPKRLLCCTTALDNGINIAKGFLVKHIIIDVDDLDTFIQCLGRKRVDSSEQIILYIVNQPKNTLVAELKKVEALYKPVFELKELGISEITRKYSRSLPAILYLVLNDDGASMNIAINKCMRIYLENRINLLNQWIHDDSFDYVSAVLSRLGLTMFQNYFNSMMLPDMEHRLDELKNKKFFIADREDLYSEFTKFGCNFSKRSISYFNSFLESSSSRFKLESKKESNNANGLKGKHYWHLVESS